MKTRTQLTKIITLIFFYIMFYNFSYSQCQDVFDRPCDCPTENDSLVIYNNALKVYEFYEKHTDYVKLETKKLRTRKDVVNCFYLLQDAVDTFTNRWQLRERVINGEDIPSVLLPRDGKNIPMSDYYQYIDAYRFYQRELENGILNISSPFPIYDSRIAPLLINSYENRFSNDEFNGDYVNVALYIPVTVKPYSMLSDSEKVIRKKILEGIIPVKIKPKNEQITKPKKIKNIENDTTLVKGANIDYVPPVVNKRTSYTTAPWDAVPIYSYDVPDCGQLWLMGYWVKRKFRKCLPTDELYDFLPKCLKDFLNDDIKLEKYLKLRFGAYYDGLLK